MLSRLTDEQTRDRRKDRCPIAAKGFIIYLYTDPVASVFKGNVVLGVNCSHGQSEILLSGNDAHFPPIHRLFGSYIYKK